MDFDARYKAIRKANGINSERIMKHEAGKKTMYLCPHCGSVLYHEELDMTRDSYPLVCLECDENFFKFECEELSEDTRIVEATIGYRMIDVSGKVEYHGGQTDNGVCYKDLDAWKTGKGVVYIGEYGLDTKPQDAWTRDTLLAFLRRELHERGVQPKDTDLEGIAEDLLDNAEWQDLSTLWNEWIYNADYESFLTEKKLKCRQ